MSTKKDQPEKALEEAESLKAEIALRDETIKNGMEANAALEAKVADLTDRLEETGGDVFDDSDYENCSWFVDTKGRKHPATDTLRRLAKHRGLRPCSAPVPGGSEDE